MQACLRCAAGTIVREIGRRNVSYAGLVKRVAASIIDGVVLLVVNFSIGFMFGMCVLGGSYDPAAVEGVGNVVGILLSWLYFAGMESSSSQGTLGKIALGIKVTDLQGNRIDFGRATGRHFAKWISLLTLLVGFFMVAFTEKQQGLHDIIAGCLVVNK
ncbi:MAG: RDD family protein [Armatimonadetes bacterium]|nr:RDD family protein [Armatimonadota bacterium]NOG92929.1 RDD family protein [Armatimonadota bacterium]